MLRRNRAVMRSKQPLDTDLWISDIKKVRLDKNYCVTKKDAYGKTYKQFYGKGLGLYSYSLRTKSGRTISIEHVRAKSVRHVLDEAKKYWKTLRGIKDL
jgi:hypothetical protein